MIILFIGDIFGKPGRLALLKHLSGLIDRYKSDFVIVNGENLADGRGITEKTLRPLLNNGVDVITSGNHLWDREEGLEYIAQEPRIVRPMNYPPMAPGNLNYIARKDDLELSVVCFTGQVFMPPCDSAFQTFDDFWESTDQALPLFIDFHAESTSEKRGFGWHVDGRASAMIGTHTHIQTADEEILCEGTGYLTDAGMTGAHDSVIGVKKEIILEKFRTSVPRRFETSDQGLMINGVVVEIDPISRQTTRLQRIRFAVEE